MNQPKKKDLIVSRSGPQGFPEQVNPALRKPVETSSFQLKTKEMV